MARSSWLERHRYAVHAIAKPGRSRAIIEDMSQMTGASCTMNLGAFHTKAIVAVLADGVRKVVVKTRPARAAVEFSRGRIERERTSSTCERAFAVLLIERTCIGVFGRCSSEHGVSLRREPLAPFRVGEMKCGGYSRHSRGIIGAYQPPCERAEGCSCAKPKELAASRLSERSFHADIFVVEGRMVTGRSVTCVAARTNAGLEACFRSLSPCYVPLPLRLHCSPVSP